MALVPFTASLFTLVVHELTHDAGAKNNLRVDASAVPGGVFFSARGAL